MSIDKHKVTVTSEGDEIYLFTLSNSNSMEAGISNFGGVILTLLVPDRNGKLDDILLGYDSIMESLKKMSYYGALVGRCANLIGNAAFKLNNTEYLLNKNFNGGHHLHGGFKGFNRVVWKPEIVTVNNEERLSLTYFSKDGEEGYPGNLNTKVTYSLTDDNALKIEYFAQTDRDTVVSLTNHAFFNLSGQASGDILKHDIRIDSDKITAIDEKIIPTGELMDVSGTPFDFRKSAPIGRRISDNHPQIKLGSGYNHNYVLDNKGSLDVEISELKDALSGRIMKVYTTMPGVQFFTGNFFDGRETGKGGFIYNKRAGLCLETQHFPDAINHSNFPSPVLKANEEYKHSTIYKFFTE